jgi:hypothetical protein
LQNVANATVVVLQDLAQLREVKISGCSALHGLWLGGCAQLESVTLGGSLSALKQLKITACERLRSVQGLRNLARLQGLELCGSSMQTVSPLERCSGGSTKLCCSVHLMSP